jgi:acetyl esterase/lipase
MPVTFPYLRGLALAALVLGAVLSPPGPAADAGSEKAAPERYEVQAHRNLAYVEGEGADRVRHKLDVYVPKGKADFPVVLFVHGGAWVFGDKNFFGVHEAVGKMFARHGIGAVLPNYRLTPKVQHPEHVKDVARAFAWTVKNVKQYGGRPDRLFLCGHSAGAHLVSLLATDESYLRAEGLSLRDVKGVMPISGMFSIPDRLFEDVFGKDPQVRKRAGPQTHVRAGCPPFLIVYADQDFPWCDVMSKEFGKALKGKGVPAEVLEVKKRNHLDIIGHVSKDGDACGQALLDFIAKHAGR